MFRRCSWRWVSRCGSHHSRGGCHLLTLPRDNREREKERERDRGESKRERKMNTETHMQSARVDTRLESSTCCLSVGWTWRQGENISFEPLYIDTGYVTLIYRVIQWILIDILDKRSWNWIYLHFTRKYSLYFSQFCVRINEYVVFICSRERIIFRWYHSTVFSQSLTTRRAD